jgi:hypothetical protein
VRHFVADDTINRGVDNYTRIGTQVSVRRGRLAQDVYAKLKAVDSKVLIETAFIDQFRQEEFSISVSSSLCR